MTSDLHARVAAAQGAQMPQSPIGQAVGGMEEFVFVQATKKQAKARIALAGPSGSGKTFTALKVASGLVTPTTSGSAPIAVIDTERGSASKYSDLFSFHTLETPMNQFDPRRLVRALGAAAKAGMQVVIIDSLSHFWNGAGGMLEQVDAAGRRSYNGNNFGGWKEAAPMERQMIDAMLAFPGHVIVTMRTKTEYIIEERNGKKVPQKVGLKPVQRDGIEYEFDVVGDLDPSNTLTVSKSRCPQLSGQVIPQPGLEVAEQVLAWLDDGKPTLTAAHLRDLAAAPTVTKEQLREYFQQARQLGLLGAAVTDDHDQVVTLNDYIIVRGHQAPAAADLAPAAAPAAAPAPEPVDPDQHQPAPPAASPMPQATTPTSPAAPAPDPEPVDPGF